MIIPASNDSSQSNSLFRVFRVLPDEHRVVEPNEEGRGYVRDGHEELDPLRFFDPGPDVGLSRRIATGCAAIREATDRDHRLVMDQYLSE